MCTNCDETNIPIGPTGATGATGAPGAAGSNGTDGVDGITILASYNDITGVGTPASLVETVLFSTTINANTLDTNGDELEIFVFYDAGLSGDDTTLRVKLGTKTYSILNPGLGAIAGSRKKLVKIKISRIGALSQLWSIEIISPNGLDVFSTTISIDNSALDLTANQTLQITGQNDVSAVANQIVLYKATVTKYLI